MAVAAPVIDREMDRWVAIGGGNSGIVGDGDHPSGFHRSAREVPATDYSRRRDPNGADGPFVDWDYACAGDFGHGGKESLRAKHREVVARLRRNDPALSMICEFIGQPWADLPVMYWARWEGFANLRQYTGSGHTTWSHISWYRSRADQPANLWTPEGVDDMGVLGLKYGDSGERVKELQWMLEYAGFDVGTVDGSYQTKTAAAVKACCGGVDGKLIAGIHSARLNVAIAKKHAGEDGAPGAPGKDGVLTLPAEFVFQGSIRPVE